MRTPHGVATARQCTSTRNNNYFYPKSRGLEHSLWLPCHHALKLPIGYPPIAVLINLVERPADLFSTHAREHLLEHCLHPGVRKEANICISIMACVSNGISMGSHIGYPWFEKLAGSSHQDPWSPADP
eukprot:TRINITY_DN2505_c0_g1_i2.p1 TRINITY_DN2505_c0_g1~~TRINITY_DN2505_c0_g1_i2.p1  ORF type:complete len:128 (-),score=2.88 TRINITY_DN2505_c0_g1_i2:336-719(-)